MFLYIQFPFADSRKFLQNTGHLDIPGWPLPTPDTEFVRYFGNIRTRKGGGLYDWVGENEICLGNKGLRFRKNPASIFSKPKNHNLFRSTYRHLYFDGWAVGKFEVSIVTKRNRKSDLTDDQITNLIDRFLSLPVEILNPLGRPHSCELVWAGKPITRLYTVASTTTSSINPTSLEDWWVSPGSPILFLEYRGRARESSPFRENVQLPYTLKLVRLLPKGSGLQLYHCFVPYAGTRIPMWVLNTNASFATERAKTLRMHLCRLHAEHECLRLILRNIMTDKITVSPRTREADFLQYYLNRAMRRIRKSNSKYTDEIIEIARASATLIKPGQYEILCEHLENLDIRRNILLNAHEYLQQWNNVVLRERMEVNHLKNNQGDTINISNVQTGILNIKSTTGEVNQTVNDITSSEQLSYTEPETQKTRLEKATAEEITEAVDFSSELKTKDTDLQRIQKERNHYLSLIRLSAGMLFATIGLAVILIVPLFLPWVWLNNHPSRLGLYGCTIAIIISISWAIIDQKRRAFALGTLAVGAVLVMFQIIGR